MSKILRILIINFIASEFTFSIDWINLYLLNWVFLLLLFSQFFFFFRLKHPATFFNSIVFRHFSSLVSTRLALFFYNLRICFTNTTTATNHYNYTLFPLNTTALHFHLFFFCIKFPFDFFSQAASTAVFCCSFSDSVFILALVLLRPHQKN